VCLASPATVAASAIEVTDPREHLHAGGTQWRRSTPKVWRFGDRTRTEALQPEGARTMDYETIIYEKRDGIADLIFNRPEKLNAISFQVVRECLAALEDAEADEDVGVVIISGAGRAFTSGDDMTDPEAHEAISNATPGERFFVTRRRHYLQVVEVIRGLMKPVIASVDGWCIGSGPIFAMACDIVIASDSSQFGSPLVSIGHTGVSPLLPEVVGYHKACELLFTADLITAKEAEAIGMVNHVVPAEQLESTVRELAAKLAKQSSPLIGWTKWALNRTLGSYSVEQALDYKSLTAALMQSSKYVPSSPNTHGREGMIYSRKGQDPPA
jgi:enoyl-CoA hydratase/carnithine racemase